MKNLKILKKLVIVMLSLVLVTVCSTSVFAADDDVFTTVDSNKNTSNTAENNATGNEIANNANGNTNSNTNSNTNNSLTARNTNTNTNTNNNTSNTNRNVSNTLAKTGLSNTSGIIALVLVVCGVSAIYSYKKVNDYKKL